jgi:hypothetical protein
MPRGSSLPARWSGLALLPLAGVLLAASAPAACSRKPRAAAAAAPAPDVSRTQRSSRGNFVATIAPDSDPIPINQIHAWKLHLRGAGGQPIEGAKIRVYGLMPEHNHGMATQPRVTEYLKDGTYLVDGIKLQMRGWWTIRFAIEQGRLDDDVTFHVVLP